MSDYYSKNLSANRLKRCYEIAAPRVKSYLEAETQFVIDRIKPTDCILELGCGYGRVLQKLVGKAQTIIGIDTSLESLQLAQKMKPPENPYSLLNMNALALGFRNHRFDLVFCIQNGISAFRIDQRRLFAEAMRVTRPGGVVLFSSYSERFWHDRLHWFKMQANEGLVGEIDFEATGQGMIACKDGFRSGTVSPNHFAALASNFKVEAKITEVDKSSVFCELLVEE